MFYCGAQVRAAQKSYKLSSGCGHDPWRCSKLERHGSSRMQISGWLEMPLFLNRISICIPSEIARHDLLVLLLIIPLRVTLKGDCPFHAAAPFLLFYFSCIQTRIWFKPTVAPCKIRDCAKRNSFLPSAVPRCRVPPTAQAGSPPHRAV